MAQRHSAQKDWDQEKPNSARAVVATLRAVTLPVPKALVSRSLRRLDTQVPIAMITLTIPI